MANSIGALPLLVLPVDPLPDIYDRLIPLVVNHFPWWRDGLLRWAAAPPAPGADRIRLPIPLPESLTADEEIAILAAIYDHHAAAAARINPWRDLKEQQAFSQAPSNDEFNLFVREYKAAIHDLTPYHLLRDLVPTLSHNWDRDKSAIEAMIVNVERRIEAHRNASSSDLSNEAASANNSRNDMVASTTKKSEVFIAEKSDAKIEPQVVGEDNQTAKRPAYKRDHLFLRWYNASGSDTFHSHATIRDKWNNLGELQRKEICHLCAGVVTRETVIESVKNAAKETAATKE